MHLGDIINKKIFEMMEDSRILILANDEDINENLGFILKQLRYRYLVAGQDYARAMKLLSTNQIRCVLLPLLDEAIISLAQAIYQAYQVPCIFYTTHFTDQTIEQIKGVLRPVYLTKIYDKDEVYINIELACHNHKYIVGNSNVKPKLFNTSELSFFIKNKHSFYKINYHEIVYIKSEPAYIKIYTKEEESYLIRSSLSALLEELPSYFCRVHRSYIVNLKNVDVIHDKSVHVGINEIPLGKNYQNELIELINCIK